MFVFVLRAQHNVQEPLVRGVCQESAPLDAVQLPKRSDSVRAVAGS